jgi:hypothetical protein
VSDLKGELQQLADDAARQAWPLAAADVIRQGDRRHGRIITRRSLAGAWAFRRARPAWRLAVSAGLTVALAAGVLTAVTVNSGSADHAPQVITVADLANLAAAAAARQPNVRPGQWVYRKMLVNVANSDRSAPRLITGESWVTADHSKQAFYLRGKLVVQRSPFPIVPSYRSLGSLPADPRALVARLSRIGCPAPAAARGWSCSHIEAFVAIGMMLGSYVLPPRFTAELYRALADIPGVRLNKNAVDVAGQRGSGFVYPQPRGTGRRAREALTIYQEIIISSRTYLFMGQYDGPNVFTSKLDGEAIVRRAFVSGPGVRP